MRYCAHLGLMVALGLWLAACTANGPIRVYVEPTYERDQLQQLLAAYPDLKLLLHPDTEDVRLRVEAVPQPAGMRTVRAVVKARARRTGYEVHAVAELLPRRNHEAVRARWVNSYTRDVYENPLSDILHEMVVEAAHADHRDFQRTPEEVERAASAVLGPSSP